jgi:hypothetical protein
VTRLTCAAQNRWTEVYCRLRIPPPNFFKFVNLKTFPQGLDERTYVVVTVAVSFSVFGDHPDQTLSLTTPAALNFAEMGKK